MRGRCLPQAGHIVATSTRRFEYPLNGSVRDLPGTSVWLASRDFALSSSRAVSSAAAGQRAQRDEPGYAHDSRHDVEHGLGGVGEVEPDEVRDRAAVTGAAAELGEPGRLAAGRNGGHALVDERRRKLGPEDGDQDGAEYGEAEARAVIANGLGDTGGLP